MAEDKRTAKEKLEDNGYEDIIIIDEDSFRESCIGVTGDDRAVYDYSKMIEEYSKAHNISWDDAMDYIEYNIIRALSYYGAKAPVVFYPFDI